MQDTKVKNKQMKLIKNHVTLETVERERERESIF